MARPPPSHSCPRPKPQIMHGGLFSEDGVTLDDIRKIERNRQPPDSGDWMGPRQPLPPRGPRRLQQRGAAGLGSELPQPGPRPP